LVNAIYFCKMKHYIVLILITALISCNAQSDDEKEMATLLKQAPYTELTDSIKKFKNVDSLYFKRGVLLTQNKQYLTAIVDFEKAYALNNNQDNGVFLGAAYINAQKYQEALKHLESFIKKYPTNLMARERLAFCYEQLGKPNEAIALYDSILQQDPEDFVTMATKAYALQQAGNDAEAIIWFEKSYNLMPNKTVGNELVLMYAETKNPNTIDFCDKVLQQDTGMNKSVQAIYAKGLYYKNIGNTTAALPFFNECIQKDYTFPYAYLDKGIIHYDQKNYGEAIKTLELAKEVDNQNAEVYYRMGLCMQATGNKDAAILEFQRAIALDKNYTVAIEALEKAKKQ
jgi:tetratricopeptide (TPR) repeat protein